MAFETMFTDIFTQQCVHPGRVVNSATFRHAFGLVGPTCSVFIFLKKGY